MDCVDCSKCKTFGKLQIYGIGTALKILFSDDPASYLHKIRRNELVSLINTFAKASASLRILDSMHELRHKQTLKKGIIILAPLGVLLAFVVFLDQYKNRRKGKGKKDKIKI
jgi:ERO1-like protein alpha